MGNNKGFTLVELAIVMTIIGLLVGGILKGQKMVENAKLKKTISQLDGIRTATIIFLDKYNQLPGDMYSATTRLPNCTNAVSCYSGDGDSAIMALPTSPPHVFTGLATSFNSEDVQFWKHLSLSGLITSVNSGATTMGGGISHPSAPIRGYFHVYSPQVYAPPHPTGNMIALRNSIQGPYNQRNLNPLTPYEAQYIDKKMDDGNGITGYIYSEGHGVTGVGCDDDGSYDPTYAQPNCEMYYFFQK